MGGLTGVLLLAQLLTAGPVCGTGPGEAGRRAIAAELNAARADAGRRPLAPHPLLCELARERAAAIAATGRLTADKSYVEETTRRLYRGGYRPHFWTDSALVGSSLDGALGQLATVRPAWVEEAVTGEFEHLGVATATLDGQPVVTYMLALHRCTYEERQVSELGSIETVRAAALEAVNRLREEHGLPAVRGDEQLDRAAQGHAEDLLRRGYYDHRSPEGVTPGGRARAAGWAGRGPVAENIAKGLFAPGEVVERWMDSPGHRRNVLHRKVTATGFGLAVGPGETDCFDLLWVQIFAG